MAIRFTVPEKDRKDRAYWDQPLWLRIYYKLLYGFSGAILAGAVMGWLGAPNWMQWTVAVLVLIGVWMYRLAFPNGMNEVNWIKEGMAEASNDVQKDPKLSKNPLFKASSMYASPEQLEAEQQEREAKRKEREKHQAAERKAAAVKEARKKNRKNR